MFKLIEGPFESMEGTVELTEEMFASGKPAAQGEVLIWMKKYAPKIILERMGDDFVEMKLEHGKMILGHSETKHHHVLEPMEDIPVSKAAQALIDKTNDMIVDLKILHSCKLVHHRSDDTHAELIFPPGEYVRGIREEQTIKGWTRVID